MAQSHINFHVTSQVRYHQTDSIHLVIQSSVCSSITTTITKLLFQIRQNSSNCLTAVSLSEYDLSWLIPKNKDEKFEL